MKRPITGLLAAIAVLFPAAGALGQTATPPPAKPEPKPAPTLTAVAVRDTETRFDIELLNTSAEEAVRQLGEKVGYPINVIFAGDSAGRPLPNLQLRKVSLTDFFAALNAAGAVELKNGGPGWEFKPVDGAANIYTFTVIQPAPHYAARNAPPTADPTFARPVVVEGGATAREAQRIGEMMRPNAIAQPAQTQWAPYGAAMSGKAAQKSTLFFDLSKVLDKTLTIEDVTTAIRTGWAAAADGKEPAPEALKFHQESKLLIATGAPEHLDAVTNIVRLLENRRLPSKDEQDRTIESLRLRIEEMNEQNQRLGAKLDEEEKVRNQTVRKLQDQIASLEIELAKRGRPQ